MNEHYNNKALNLDLEIDGKDCGREVYVDRLRVDEYADHGNCFLPYSEDDVYICDDLLNYVDRMIEERLPEEPMRNKECERCLETLSLACDSLIQMDVGTKLFVTLSRRYKVNMTIEVVDRPKVSAVCTLANNGGVGSIENYNISFGGKTLVEIAKRVSSSPKKDEAFYEKCIGYINGNYEMLPSHLCEGNGLFDGVAERLRELVISLILPREGTIELCERLFPYDMVIAYNKMGEF